MNWVTLVWEALDQVVPFVIYWLGPLAFIGVRRESRNFLSIDCASSFLCLGLKVDAGPEFSYELYFPTHPPLAPWPGRGPYNFVPHG